MPLPAAIRSAQERVGARASICVSDRFAGPITFGVIRPVIVFPPSVSTMPPHVQEAIAYHELLHVRRRDWLFEIAEEAVRTVFWFHPAIWWLIGRVRLSREQVVDQAAIRLTESQGTLRRGPAGRGARQIPASASPSRPPSCGEAT